MNRSRTTSVFEKLEKAGTYAEDGLLFVILIGMILLAGAQIVLRNFFDSGIFWGDELLRLMVLWLTVAGGLAASRIDKHISIAVLDRFSCWFPVAFKNHYRPVYSVSLCVICLA